MLKVAVLDDYQNVSKKYGRWNRLENKINLIIFNEFISSKNKLIKRTFNRLKILGSGDLKTKLNIEADFVSKSAKIKLDKLGCSVSIKTIS